MLFGEMLEILNQFTKDLLLYPYFSIYRYVQELYLDFKESNNLFQ